MRVIAGEKRHLLLKTLDDLSIRPTTDKIKETLFNMIQFDIPGKSFLDLFAGSGAIGIEALSRGSSSATFIDNNDRAIKVIKGDASLSLENLSRENETYGIVFMDPPYDKGLYRPVFERLAKSNLIDDNTKIILEVGLKDDADGIEDLGFEITKIKKYKSN